MKRHWIVVSNGEEVVTGFDDFHMRRPLTFADEPAAEGHARALAEENPGTKYSVFALVSSFVINVMTEERAQ